MSEIVNVGTFDSAYRLTLKILVDNLQSVFVIVNMYLAWTVTSLFSVLGSLSSQSCNGSIVSKLDQGSTG